MQVADGNITIRKLCVWTLQERRLGGLSIIQIFSIFFDRGYNFHRNITLRRYIKILQNTTKYSKIHLGEYMPHIWGKSRPSPVMRDQITSVSRRECKQRMGGPCAHSTERETYRERYGVVEREALTRVGFWPRPESREMSVWRPWDASRSLSVTPRHILPLVPRPNRKVAPARHASLAPHAECSMLHALHSCLCVRAWP